MAVPPPPRRRRQQQRQRTVLPLFPSSVSLLLLLLSLQHIPVAQALRPPQFPQPSQRRQQHQHPSFPSGQTHPAALASVTSTTAAAAAVTNADESSSSSSSMDPSEAFHKDMRRVLAKGEPMVAPSKAERQQQQTRRHTNSNSNKRSNMMERKTKPATWTEDVDGAQRCRTMLTRLVQSGVATETSFQIVMEAFLKRGRVRWMSSCTTSPTSLLSSRNGIPHGVGGSNSYGAGLVICAADQLEELLQELEDTVLASTNEEGARPQRLPTVETCNLCLAAYANCATPRGDRQYAGKAGILLERLCGRYDNNKSNENDDDDDDDDDDTIASLPSGRDDNTSNSILSSSSPPSSYPIRPPSLHEPSEHDAALVDSILHVLHAYAWQQANLQPGDCASTAQALLERVCRATTANERDDSNDNNKTPRDQRRAAYTLVVEAWSKSRNGAIPCQKAFDALRELLSECGEDEDDRIDAEAYSNVILAWAKSEEDGAAETAHELLLEMVEAHRSGTLRNEPPLISFNGVVAAWGRVGRADRAQDVLWLMEDLRQSQSCPSLVPNAVSYNSILHGMLRMPDRADALDKTQELVRYMEENSQLDQPAIEPNAFTYHTLMKSWIQSGRPEAAERAHALLQRMEDMWNDGDDSVVPTNRMYNMVINAYAKSKGNARTASRVAMALLQRLKGSRHCQPDNITYTSVIECVSKSGDEHAPQIAQELLREASARYSESKDPAVKPNLRTYTMTIQALAKNNGSCQLARALLTRLLDKYESSKDPQLRPNTFPYNYVLNCAANTMAGNDPIAAFQIATETYQDLRKSPYVTPDSYSYAFWIKCCNNLLEPGDLRTKCVTYALEECKKDGLVSNEVLTRLFQGSSPAVIDSILATGKKRPTFAKQNQSYRSMKIQDLPPAWSRNIRSGIPKTNHAGSRRNDTR